MFWIWTLLTIPTKATASSPLGVTIVALLVPTSIQLVSLFAFLPPSHPFASQETDLSLEECSQFLWLLLTLRINSKSFLQKSALTPGSYLSLLSPPSPATPATLLLHEHTEFLPALTVPFASPSPNPRVPSSLHHWLLPLQWSKHHCLQFPNHPGPGPSPSLSTFYTISRFPFLYSTHHYLKWSYSFICLFMELCPYIPPTRPLPLSLTGPCSLCSSPAPR